MNVLVNVEKIEAIIGYSFKNKGYPILAFTHSSYANENNCTSNERIEFLGDSILNFIVAEQLYKNSQANEGKLSRTRANIVSETPLAGAVKKLGLEQFLLIGRSLVAITDAVRADLFESVVGAIYLDGGMDAAKTFVNNALELHNTIKSAKSGRLDYKSTLYELAQERKFSVEFIEISRQGPDHNPIFTYAVLIDGVEQGRGSAGSIKAAQTAAAGVAVSKLR